MEKVVDAPEPAPLKTGFFANISFATFAIILIAILIFVAVFAVLAYVLVRDKSDAPKKAPPEKKKEEEVDLDDLEAELKDIQSEIADEYREELEDISAKRIKAISELHINAVEGVEESSSSDDGPKIEVIE